ncbi:hypothetical protein H0H81_006048 [Sphagnurus paluster]|uniref:Uncharacterized protein n=1 Tax=Sphagnurus paluster TaxID=117069 RepID=A0A9P7GLA7_9AGAR|nr:hypothetical protein H0H81_006048 [Sphagnurus paluster]
MRTPSLYSQDDPLSAALKPPPSETEAERIARQTAEVEAKKVSEQIDEELRQEREQMKRNKGDVKLLLLGQAESGKSTLQKQFQLMYKPSSIDLERTSWKTVIYFNVVHSLKHILATLEAWDDCLDEDSLEDLISVSQTKMPTDGILQQSSTSALLMNSSALPSPAQLNNAGSAHQYDGSQESSMAQIANLRLRLTPLMATDAPLADRLSGGIAPSGSGKGGVYVRSGWQARTIENALGRIRPNYEADSKKNRLATYSAGQDILVQDVGRMLTAAKDDIKELWDHPTVKGLITRRKLKLDEWSELCGFHTSVSNTHQLTPMYSFLQHISRIAATDYIPSTGTSVLISILCIHAYLSLLKTTFYTRVYKPWASLSTFLT